MQLPNHPELEAEIAKCRTADEISRVTKSFLENNGVIRSDESGFGVHLLRVPETKAKAPLPMNGYKYEKTITFHPDSRKRNLVIRANTPEDLRDLENSILGQ